MQVATRRLAVCTRQAQNPEGCPISMAGSEIAMTSSHAQIIGRGMSIEAGWSLDCDSGSSTDQIIGAVVTSLIPFGGETDEPSYQI